ncbi:MAG: hypothetical protein M1818_007479 [Claussenomyces sp. TS43310]|nr:MAG: hypothetical protein M1818_007479 [Claussenomyces sp. TS43310]
MPRAIRPATSHGQYRTSPIAIASAPRQPTQGTYLSNAAAAATMQANTMQSSHSQPMSHHPQSYQTGGPVQPTHAMSQMQPQYHAALAQAAPMPVRASSGAWTPADDATLMAARSQGQNWAPIQAAYFPNKTPNACRKRHERLMERRNSDDWDVVKLERMAKEYMILRKDMWSMLAERTGEKWAVLEAKCMTSGVKNLSSAARACTRRERLSDQHQQQQQHHPGHSYSHSADHGAFTDDSGIGLDDLDLDVDAEAEYGTDTGGTVGSYGGHHHQQHHQQHLHPQQYRTNGRAHHSLSPDEDVQPMVGGGGGGGVAAVAAAGGRGGYDLLSSMSHQQGQQYMMQQQRISSIDMGIPSIINRGA